MRNMPFMAALTAFGLVACGEKSKSEAKSSAPAPTPKQEDLVVTGHLSLETNILHAKVFVFGVNEAAQTTAPLNTETLSDADGNFAATIPAGALGIEVSKPLITMSVIPASNGSDENVLWSFVLPDERTVVSNLNALTSISYEVAVLEQDLAASVSVGARIAQVFATVPAIETIGPTDAKLVRLGKLVTLVATRLALTVGDVHKTIAADVRDGTLDGLAVTTPVEIVDHPGIYTHVALALKAVVAGNEPDYQALATSLPAP